VESAISYTPEELAGLLRVSKLTVYDLIKKGELPAYRVGKQMRVDNADLEAYKRNKRMGGGKILEEGKEPAPAGPLAQSAIRDHSSLVITGQDQLLDLVARHMEERCVDKRPLRSMMGSLDGLFSLYRGESDLVSTHLFDGDTGQYNLPYIRRILIGFPCVVIHLAERTAGLYVAPGNPRQLLAWEHLATPGIRLANREKGSGARVLLEEELRLLGLRASSVLGYEREFRSHMSVAGQVAAGNADAGVGSERGALTLEVDFVPLRKERIDLVMVNKPENRAWIKEVCSLLASAEFQAELSRLGGYHSASTGSVIWESD